MSERETPFRYDALRAEAIELKWQQRWEDEGTFMTPNPGGDLAEPNGHRARLEPMFVLDMFPYPSGSGLHVGHPLGYIATDVYARFKRMCGFNVLHAMGYDSFGLPAERFAAEHGRHPAETTSENIAAMRTQLRRIGLGHDPRRAVSTTDVEFFRWTQAMFLEFHNAYYDEERGAARPIGELVAAYERGDRVPEEGSWALLDAGTRRAVLDRSRLAYLAEVEVNWCPMLGTVLANEEVTSDGVSVQGGLPVVRRPLRQWMMRITEYADRLVDDLDGLDWPAALKTMQRNWVGRSRGLDVRFAVGDREEIEVFTTRPDTIFGVTFVAVAPEHPLLDGGAGTIAEEALEYRAAALARSERQRKTSREATGAFTGLHATHPLTGARIPVFVAAYVLAGYGSGAVMGVPAHDDRDFRFAKGNDIEVIAAVRPPVAWLGEHGLDPDAPASTWPCAFTGGEDAGTVALPGHPEPLGPAAAAAAVGETLVASGHGTWRTAYKLRDWLFSRQRYWGEPFPVVYDADGQARALPVESLPVLLPELEDFVPTASEDPDAMPEPPLARATEWLDVELDLGDGLRTYRRETNTMPQWAGSCWYYLRYLDPSNDEAFVAPEIERYWMGGKQAGGVDLYVGGAEHAVLHLLYARFWHKVLFDLGHVSSPEPFQRLVNQGYVLADAFTEGPDAYVDAARVEERDGVFLFEGRPVERTFGKMGKSLKNGISPEVIYAEHGADALRLYESFLAPIEQDRPWSTHGILGISRFLQRTWRLLVDEETGALRVHDGPATLADRRLLNRTIAEVRDDLERLRLNTAIPLLMTLVRRLQQADPDAGVAREVAEPLVLLLAPFAPHIAEELWEAMGHSSSLTYEPYPVADPALLSTSTVEVAVQVDGRRRGSVTVPDDADQDAVVAAAEADSGIANHLAEDRVHKVIFVPGRVLNFVSS